jgi:hypothetical protein
MTIDLLGGVFNALSLAFKPKFDIIAGVCYLMVVVRPVPFTRLQAIDTSFRP